MFEVGGSRQGILKSRFCLKPKAACRGEARRAKSEAVLKPNAKCGISSLDLKYIRCSTGA
jgi:hypothetical protein